MAEHPGVVKRIASDIQRGQNRENLKQQLRIQKEVKEEQKKNRVEQKMNWERRKNREQIDISV